MIGLTPTVPLAFVAGLVSFLSPCVFPLMPVYAAYLGGQAGSAATATARRTVLFGGAAFVAGFMAVFVVLFYVLVALEVSFLTTHRHAVNVVSGIIVIALGLQTMGLIRVGWLMREWRIPHPRNSGVIGAFLLGVGFAAGWSPCLGPVLGAILQVAADGGYGGLPLMLVYCAGLAVPFLLVAVLLERARGVMRRINQHLGAINLIAGSLLLIFGLLLAFDRVTALNQWALGTPFDL